MCAVEPLVDIQLPGKARVSFKQVTEDKVKPLLESVLAGKIPTDMVLGQFSAPGVAPWHNVDKLSDHPFFAPQTRWVLKNCGVINPSRLEEYVASGGYRALTKVIHSMTPVEVCALA